MTLDEVRFWGAVLFFVGLGGATALAFWVTREDR